MHHRARETENMKHKSEKSDGSLIATTELAESLGPDMVLGLRQSEAWLMADALSVFATETRDARPAGAELADRLAKRLRTELRGTPTLRAV